ncbi:Beige/BEACH domain containing protein [Tritrichomonas foetus]|uniref:Beige/BEACH domain containing protein n=1 Tax=Tritrichomonas foetus TaxID=1144522 RepID=A0A1J4KV43_9EUKA|nr:Beige/BEACH domain containing protein [Tritrichomonas foetus]|eukprot:OHT15010.1 Beige/BEACH domain containing protein [Tritrichomonas foetus]
MQTLLSPNDLCASILLIRLPKSNSENKSSNIANSRKSAFSEISFPHFQKEEIHSILSDLKGNNSFTKVLMTHKFDFSVKEKNFSISVLNDSNSQKEFCLVLFYSYLQINISKEKHQYSQNHCEELLISLLNSMKWNYVRQNKKLYTIFISCFVDLFKLYFQVGKIDEKLSFQILQQFFTDSKIIPEKVYILLCHAAKSFKETHILNNMVTFVDSMIQQSPKSFPKEIAVSFLKTITPLVNSLDSLLLFDHLIPIVGVDSIMTCIPLLPNSVVSEIQKKDPLNCNGIHSSNQYKAKVIKLPENTSFSTPFTLVDWKTFEKPIDFSYSIMLPPTKALEDMIRPEVLTMISYILSIANQEPKLIPNLFNAIHNFLNSSLSSYSIDETAAFLFIAVKLNEIDHQFIPTKFLLNPIILNPSITAFAHNENWDAINTLRSEVLQIFIQSGVSSLNSLFYEIMCYPLLFAEFIYRFIDKNMKISKSDVITLSQLFMYSMTFYQNFKDVNENELDAINIARTSIFYFFKKSFEDIEKLILFFQDPFFIETFLSLVFEYYPRQFVLPFLSTYLNVSESLNDKECVKKINRLLEISCDSLDNPNIVSVCFELLKTLNNVMTNCRLMSFYFEPLTSSFCKGILKLQTDNESRNFLMELITFFALTAEFHKVVAVEVAALQSSLITAFGDEPPQSLFIGLVHLIAGQKLDSIHPSFHIHQPKALKLLLAIYIKSQILPDLFTFVARLCQFSTKNCIEAHNGEVDLFLIDILYKWRNDPTIPLNLIASSLSLLMLISTTISSVSTVQRFISLFSPVKGRYLPKYHCLTLKSLNKMFINSQKRPISCLPLREPCTFEIEGIKGESIEKGFSIAFWIFHILNDPQYKAQIFSLYDSKGQRITLFLQDSTIVSVIDLLLNNGQKKQWSGKSSVSFQENSWNLATFVVEHDSESSHISFSVNAEHFHEIIINKIQFTSGVLQSQIGGFSCNASDNPSLLGSIGVFHPLNKEQISKIYKSGRNNKNIYMYNPICLFMSDEKDGHICMHNIVRKYNNEEIKTSKISIPSTLPSSFSTILVKKCNICMLIPLFAQWGMTTENGDNVENIQDMTFDLIENALILSADGQEQFGQSGGFKILLHLLLNADPKFITFYLYKRFYNLFNLLSDTSCREQLFDYILINIELWINSYPEEQIQILNHWDAILVPDNLELFMKKRSLSWLFSILRKHYWYSCVEDNTITLNKDRQKINVKECRKPLLHIAFQLAPFNLYESDFRCFMSNILTCSDYHQTKDLLVLLKCYIAEYHTSLANVKDNLNIIPILQYLFNSQNDGLICLTLESIILSHRNGIISNFSLASHIDIILHQLTPSFVSKSLLTKLLTITKNGAPEIFPICSWMAMNIGNSGMREMLNTLKPSKEYSISEYWATWCIVALFKADEKLQRFIARYLVKSSTNFYQLFATCEVIGRAMKEDISKIKQVIVVEYGKLLLRDDFRADINDIVHYFELVRHFIFFHSETQNNNLIEKLYENSPFKPAPIKSQQKAVFDFPSPIRLAKPTARRFKARFSLHPKMILDNEGYSEKITEQAVSLFNQIHQDRDEINDQTSPRDSFENKTRSYRSKRMSMLTIGHATFTNKKKVQPEIKIINMTPCELDSKIRSVASEEISYTFGLKFNDNMNWSDFEIAKQAISVFLKNPDTRVADTIVLLCSFMIHYSTEEVLKAIPLLNRHCTNLSGAFNFFNHHCAMCGINPVDSNENQVKNYLFKIENESDRSFSTGPLRFLKHFLKFESENANTALDVFAMINESIIGLSTSIIAEYTDECGHIMDTASKMWHQHWHHMTMDRAPWHRSLSSTQEAHFKRDFTLCSNYCPSKVRRNYNFDDHMRASLIRDTGNIHDVQKIINQYKVNLAEQYRENSPNSLLDIIEDKERVIGFDNQQENNQYKVSQCIIELPSEFINVKRVTSGTFALLTNSIVLTKSEKKTIIINLSDITNVFLRTRFHHPTAIEVFTQNGKSYFINFPNVKAIQVLKSFKATNLPRTVHVQNLEFKSYFQNTKITDDWVHRKITNYEYLMKLNMMSGRSFNDCSQYPVLPWIISDYESKSIDLMDKNIYRDLSKPTGALNDERLQQLIEKWQLFDKMDIDSYLYSSGFVCPLSVYLWLIRQEPFTSLHIDIQSGRFDHAARLFFSIRGSYYISTHHQNDFRELIPEFYSSPEFLLNTNHFDLGVVKGQKVDDVELPPWASSAFEFVYIMRKALESEYVSEHLQNWIDLIWGDKQRGEKAKQANNVFMKEMYDDVWTPENLSDPFTRAQIEAIQCHVGQVPPQLFDKPHPQRHKCNKPRCFISKEYSFEMPTSRLIVSSIDQSLLPTKRIISFAAVDLSGQLIEVSIPLSSLVTKPEKRSLKTRKTSNDINSLRQNSLKLPSEFVNSSQISKPCQTVRKDVYCKFSKHQFGLVSANGYDVYIAHTNNGMANFLIHHRSEITHLASDGSKWIAIGDKDSNLTVYFKNEFKYSIQTFTKSITCLSICFGFKQIVCGTSDGSLLFCSINDRSIVRVVDLDGYQPVKVLITKNWGFVVVYMTKIDEGKLSHHLTLYSINGDLIRNVEIEHPIDRLLPYQSPDGFDYIIASDDRNNLYSFEAFYLNIKTPFYLAKSCPSSMSFIPEENIAVHVLQDGSIIFIPFEI